MTEKEDTQDEEPDIPIIWLDWWKAPLGESEWVNVRVPGQPPTSVSLAFARWLEENVDPSRVEFQSRFDSPRIASAYWDRENYRND